MIDLRSQPDGAEVIDAGGMIVMPGMVDLHYHGCPTSPGRPSTSLVRVIDTIGWVR